MKRSPIACLLFLALLMIGAPLRVSRAEDDLFAYSVEEDGPVAENLTGRCRLSSNLRSTAYSRRLTDEDLKTSQIFKAGHWVSLSWEEDVPVEVVYLAFRDYPGPYMVRQMDSEGVVIQEETGSFYVNHAVFVTAETRAVTVAVEGEIDLCSLTAYGAGAVPGYHPWQPTPEKLDYLIVAMHPDDDVLYMGAIVPLYTVDQGLVGSIYYAATKDRIRKDEAGDGAWVMGLRTAPILGVFPDIPPQYQEKYQKNFTEKAVTVALVKLLRQYRPEVVFSHDVYGEYGHWQHKLLAQAVKEAVQLAAKAYYDPPSAKQYGVWKVKKLYLHLYAKNKIALPVHKPIAAFGGLTPAEIAAAAIRRHVSQLSSRHTVLDEEGKGLSDFGLVYSAVGQDTPGLNDPFEHIDPATLHGFSPDPSDAPASTDADEPNDSTEPADTNMQPNQPLHLNPILPLFSATALAAVTPLLSVAQPLAMQAAEAAAEVSPLIWVLPALLALAAVLTIVISFFTKRWWQRILLWAAALLLSVGAALLLVDSRPAATDTAAADPAAPTNAPVHELVFTTETLPQPADLAAYPELRRLDVTACEQVTPAWYEAIRQSVPASCHILWSVPLTDGRFPSDSTELTLPRLTAEDGALLSYFEDLCRLDASGSTATDALLSLAAERPDLALTFTLPVGDETLTMDDTSLAVKAAPDFDLLARALIFFPQLKELDLTEAPVAPADAVALSDLYPELAISYTVPIGSLRFPTDSSSIALADSGIQTVQELTDALVYLPDLMEADFHGTGLTLDDVLTIMDARPELILSQTVELLGHSVELDAQELDLRDADVTASELAPLLKPFSALQRVYLPQTPDVETVAAQLQADHPRTLFVHPVTVFGQTIDNTVEELDVSGTAFVSPQEVLAELPKLPLLKKLVMCDCALSNEQMEELLAARPEVKFVWTIHLGHHAVRTDALGFSTKNPTRYTQPYYSDHVNRWIKTVKRLNPGDIQELKYCTDLVALDLGHNYLENSDLEVFQYLPHLQILILADNRITDISALHQLKELRYVELFMNRIPDVSPLVGLENLVDINIANIHLSDITPLYSFTQAERLWFSLNDLPASQCKAVAAALPNCTCNYTAKSSTGDGWREHERYFWMHSYFEDDD